MNHEHAGNLSSYISVTGSLDERIRSATGLANLNALTEKIHQREAYTGVDLLISNVCNQECPECFFRERDKKGVKKMTELDLDNVRDTLHDIEHLSPDMVTVYPREITTELGLLEIFAEQGISKALTNGKSLGDQRVLDALRRTGIKELMVTVPGNEDSYAIYTGERPESYEQLLRNIRIAVDFGLSVDVFYPVIAQNVNDIEATVERLIKAGVKSVNFNRVIPTGNAVNLPDEYFLTPELSLELLYRINEARKRFDRTQIDISLYGLKLGPNFYNKNTFRILAGQANVWPHHLYEYLCPMVGNHYIGVSYETNDVYPCFQGLSFPELKMGTYQHGEITRTAPILSADELSKKLRGQCAQTECEYQSLCLGGCRITAFAFAKRRGEPEPLFAGQDVCMTRLFDQLKNE